MIKEKEEKRLGAKIVLEGGREIWLVDTLRDSLRSSFVVHPRRDDTMWEVFTQGPSSPVPGDPTIMATRTHTNILRSGVLGLPCDWEMLVYSWRAGCADLSQPVLDWAAETNALLVYNYKQYNTAVLIDLLLDRRVTFTDDPIHVRENLGYKVVVETTNAKALAALRDHLRKPNGEICEAVAELETLARMTTGVEDPWARRVVTSVRHVQEILKTPERLLLCWIDLEGYLSRPCC